MALRKLLATSEPLEVEERAAALLDWAMERIDASRCALVPFAAGSAGPPLAARLRSPRPVSLNPRKVPRAILEHVARTRQPVLGGLAAPGEPLTSSTTMKHQMVRSYLAVPVLVGDEVRAVCYADRFGEAEDFTDADCREFETFAYELAGLVTGWVDQVRRAERETVEAPPPSPAMAPVLERARLLARHADENLLVLGESGVGKEMLARLVHQLSGRTGAFVAVNVAALPSELFESELMGSVRGAFTGAVERTGRIVGAHRGTLFLDEIGDLPLLQQVKLLRFLQDRRVVPVGSARERTVDVRVIAATNRDLDAMTATGEFRRDLFHRFAPALRVPPLRERVEEILPLAEGWLAARAAARGGSAPHLTDDARVLLAGHDWPGNVRQLEMVLSHAALLAPRGRVDAAIVRSLLQPSADTGPRPPAAAPAAGATTWDEWQRRCASEERAWVERLLERHDGVAEIAARASGCPASTLRFLMRRHGLGRRPG
jgi:transcriptional regulator with GAF, ATPase, and Fis domain